MSRRIALLFSVIFHPALIPLLGVAIIFVFSPFYMSSSVFLLVATYVFLGTYLFPLLLLLVLKKMKMVSSLHLSDPKERVYPYLTSALFFYLTAASLSKFPIPLYIPSYLYAGMLIVGVALIFLKRIKISMHMAGMGGLVALILFLSYQFSIQFLVVIAMAFLVSGVVGTSRLILKAHSTTEVYLGFLLGLVSVGVGLFII